MNFFKGYDAYKLRSPDDNRKTYDCDCCGQATSHRHIQQCWTPSGVEAWACPECRGIELEDDFDGPE